METEKIICTFYDSSSKKSILTYSKEKELIEGGSKSIVKICKDNNIKECYGISNEWSAFIEGYKNLKEIGVEFRFGLEMWITNDCYELSEQSVKNESKIIIFAKNTQAYYDLIKIYSDCYCDKLNFYYKHRYSWVKLKEKWTDNLILVLPFYDSFLARNSLDYNVAIIPDLPCDPIIFREQNSQLPMESTLNKVLDEYNKDKKYEEVRVKTCFYENYDDLDIYMTYRGMHNRATISKPQMEFMGSNTFCFQDWKELIK